MTSPERDRRVADAFVFVATALAQQVDIVELLAGLTAQSAGLLDVAAAGLLLAGDNGQLQMMAASSEELHQLEAFQLQVHQGPCVECYQRSTPVLVTDLRERAAHWPRFALAALTAGFWSVHAVPLRFREQTIGYWACSVPPEVL